MSQINIVTFDAAGTLLQPWPSVGAVYGKTARNMGINVDDYDIEIRFRNAFATAESSNKIKYGNEKSFWKNIVEITFQPFANKENIEPLFESLWEAFATGKTWKLADHAIETISALQKKGIQAAILSNNDSRLRLVLQDLKIEDYFEHIFISSELGFEKPDIEIFRNVETTFALPSSSFLHLGDSFNRDYLGATTAGWHAVLYGHENEHARSIHTFPQLLEIRQW